MSFDVREYARTARGSLRDELDLPALAATPLAPDVVRVIAALARLEGATMAYLRNVLVTATHKDARVTAFLVTWAFEKYWIADALDAIAEVHGVGRSGDATDGGLDAATHPAPASRGRGPVRRAIAGFAQGRPVVGAHLALALVDDWMLCAAYDRLSIVAQSAPLDQVVGRILAVKARHTAFFDEEVRVRLSASTKAARLARRELRRADWPLGRFTLDAADGAAFTGFVFGDDDGAALAAVGQSLRDLPGIGARTAAAVCRSLAG